MSELHSLVSRLPTSYACRRFTGEVIMVGEEQSLPTIGRPSRRRFLSGSREPHDCLLRSEAWYTDNDVKLALGNRATALDAAARRIYLAGGRTIGFDGLIIATGAKPVAPTALMRSGAFTLRNGRRRHRHPK